ncbi:MAG TPA: hypothetical protein PLS53_10295 [Thermoanaerobaculaceae bacterium]|nr:hypothetical protein [Thermoanaerobaculaceae bacterium]HPS78532.1 hypothetical protein [Thermoanaerobaculaceae bacterium]
MSDRAFARVEDGFVIIVGARATFVLRAEEIIGVLLRDSALWTLAVQRGRLLGRGDPTTPPHKETR